MIWSLWANEMFRMNTTKNHLYAGWTLEQMDVVLHDFLCINFNLSYIWIRRRQIAFGYLMSFNSQLTLIIIIIFQRVVETNLFPLFDITKRASSKISLDVCVDVVIVGTVAAAVADTIAVIVITSFCCSCKRNTHWAQEQQQTLSVVFFFFSFFFLFILIFSCCCCRRCRRMDWISRQNL